MTPSVSTSGDRGLLHPSDRAVPSGVVGRSVDPTAVDDADPGASEDAHGVGMVVAAVEGGLVDRLGPGARSPGVVGVGGHGVAEPLVARPSEVDRLVLAG